MTSQVQRSAAAGVRMRGFVQPKVSLEEPEGVLKIEAAQEHLPQPIHIGGFGADAGEPQP
jgi:hypothetical protein